jgi:hypothetical protein
MPTQKRPAAKTPAPAKAPAGVKAAVAAKTAAKAAPKAAPPAAPQAKAVAKPAPPAAVEQPKAVKPAKPPKLRTKPVRDSFTMPEADFALVATLKARALSAQCVAKKSELLRAGLHALAALDTPALVAALGNLDPVKIGRPKKGH